MEQELYTILKHLLNSSSVFSGVHVTRSLVLCVCFVDRCFSFLFYFIFWPLCCLSFDLGFWLPLWYLQTLLYTPNHVSKYINTVWRILLTASQRENKNYCYRQCTYIEFIVQCQESPKQLLTFTKQKTTSFWSIAMVSSMTPGLILLSVFTVCGSYTRKALIGSWRRVLRYHRGTVTRIRKSKNRQHNGQKKRDKRINNDPQNTHIKLKIE